MKSITWILAMAIVAPLSFTACDRTLSEKSSSTEGPNGTTVQKKEVVQHSDGTVTEQKESKTVSNNP